MFSLAQGPNFMQVVLYFIQLTWWKVAQSMQAEECKYDGTGNTGKRKQGNTRESSRTELRLRNNEWFCDS